MSLEGRGPSTKCTYMAIPTFFIRKLGQRIRWSVQCSPYALFARISGRYKRDKGRTDTCGTIVCLSLNFNCVCRRVFSNPCFLRNFAKGFEFSYKESMPLDIRYIIVSMSPIGQLAGASSWGHKLTYQIRGYVWKPR